MRDCQASAGVMATLLIIGMATAGPRVAAWELDSPVVMVSDSYNVSDEPLDAEDARRSAEPAAECDCDDISLEAGLRYPAGTFRLVQDTSPLAAGPQLFESAAQEMSVAAGHFGGVSAATSLLSANRRHIANTPGSSVVLGSDSKILVTTDAGGLLSKTTSGLGISTQKRSPIVSDPRVRSSSMGQLVASGSYWFAARPDLDTLVSKIDARLIQDMIVIKGPYAARYGPGFSFIDFQLLGTPRYEDGQETHGDTSTNFKSNGGQWYGRQEVWGGSEDYGFRVGYSNGTGTDYRSGDGSRIPSSYKSQNFDAAFGFDLDETSSLEVVYLRQEQTGVELPNNVFDVRFLESDGVELNYEKRDAANFDLFTIEGWYNQTRFDGNNLGSGKRAFMPLLDFAGWNGNVEAQNMSTGYSAAMTWGEEGCTNLTVGTDLRYLRQNIDEFDQTTVFNPSGLPVPPGNYMFSNGLLENFPVPDARTENPGLFFELDRPINDRLTVSAGGRFDWVHTNAASTAPLALVSAPYNTFEEFFEVDSLARNFRLPALFLTANYQVDEHVTATLAGGYAERAPSMFQLYAVSPLANAMAQYATSIVFGHPEIQAEKRWQVDAGLQANYEKFRAGAAGYFAWVEDYITLDLFLFNRQVPDLPLYGFVNTDLAILGGGELYAEYDVSPAATVFATMSYTAGRDKTVTKTGHFLTYYDTDFTLSRDTLGEQPLPMISPLEARLGIRLQERFEGRYGIEFSARIVNAQNRVATLLLEKATPGFTVVDVRGFWRPTKALTVVGGIENLGDNNYREHLDARHFVQVFQPGFNFYSGVELNY